MPTFIARILDWPWFPLVARILLTFPFWGSGLAKLIDFPAGVAEMAHQSLGMDVLRRVKTDCEVIAKVESEPRFEGRQMVMVLAPR